MADKANRYRLTPLAESDLEEIWLYTFRTWSGEQADTYYHGLITPLKGLPQAPRLVVLLKCGRAI